MKDFSMINVTFHSLERSSRRFGLHGDRRNYLQIISDLQQALSLSDYTGRERKYLEQMRGEGREPRVLGRKCYIVTDSGWVITVLRLPDWFISRPVHAGKETAKRARSFIRSRDLRAREADYAVSC